jgi:hypothetical protein
MPDDEGIPESQQVEAEAQRAVVRTISSGLSPPYEIQTQLKQRGVCSDFCITCSF